MDIIRSQQQLRSTIKSYRLKHPDSSIGFVPTMGYLHEGHLSLIRAARSENGFVIVSLFINPMQFGENEDLAQYPRDENNDIALSDKENVDILFIPDESSIYSPEHSTYVIVNNLTDSLCGAYRPNHFRGVTTIVTKLFLMIGPDRAYFGQKDGQQAIVIQQMVKDLDFDIEIRILPTVREPDGLALSSRNAYLSASARKKASILFKALETVEQLVTDGETDISEIICIAKSMIESLPEIEIQYIECRDYKTLDELTILDRPGIFAIAVFLESVRLIDNIILYPLKETDSEM